MTVLSLQNSPVGLPGGRRTRCTGLSAFVMGGGGGGVAVLPEGRQCMSCFNGGGGGGGEAVRLGLYTKTGGGGCSRQDKLTNSSLTCTAFSTKTQGTSRQKGPLRSCPVVLHRFVDTCPYNLVIGTFKYDATRNL